MSRSFWKRGKSGRVWHEFTEHMRSGFDCDGPEVDCISLCERHEFTFDHSSSTRYEPWTGDDFPPDAKMCKRCLATGGAREGGEA